MAMSTHSADRAVASARLALARRHRSSAVLESTELGTPRYEALLLTAALSIAAGLIHLMASVEHFPLFAPLGVLFAALAAFQCAWAGRIFSRPTPRVLAIGVSVSVVVVFAWAWSRTVGLPVGPEAWRAERAGPMDVAATADEIAVAFLALATVGTETSLRRFMDRGRLAVLALLILSGVALLVGAHHHG
jgi:hypothetical protein